MKKLKRLCLSSVLVALGLMNAVAQNASVFSYSSSAGNTTDGWQIADANNDGVTWGETPGLKGIVYNGIQSAESANDWLFTPEFDIEAGKHYQVSYTVSQRGSFAADVITLACGTGASAEAMTETLVTETYNNHAGMVTRHCHIYATNSGKCVLGFKITSAARNGIVVLKSLSVAVTAGQCPQPVPAMTATSDAVAKTVRLKWINSKRDTEGVAIARVMKAKVYQDDQLVTEIDDVVPGDTTQYEFTPASFGGMSTFAVSLVADSESEKVSKTIDLDDVQGALVPLYTFPLTKTEFANSWVTVNADGGVAWTYDAGSAYISSMGATVNDWVITPGYALEPGKRYVLTYKLKTSRDYPANLDVTMGPAQDAISQTKVITNYTDLSQNGFADYTSAQFDVAEAGTYYFGFHATYVGNSIDIKSITLNYIDVTGAAQDEEELTYTEPSETVLDDNDNGDLTVTRPYTERLSMEGVEMKAAITQAQIDEYTLATNGIYAVQHATGYKYDIDVNNPELAIELAGGCVYNEGLLYCNEYTTNGNYQEYHPVWKVLDAKTFEVLSTDTLSANCENTTISMAYDPTTDKIYGILKDYVDSYLVEINPENGEMRHMQSDRLEYWKRYLAIGCDQYGNLYCVYMTEDNVTGDQRHFLSRINKADGTIADIGEIQAANLMKEDKLVNMKYRQALFFDNSTQKMYWFMCSSSMALGGQYAPVFEVNPVNCNAVLTTYLQDIYAISGAYFEEPMMAAPGIISDFKYTKDYEGAVSGKISFKIPETSYNGQPMTSSVNYTVTEENGINLEGTATAGMVVEREIESTQGIHNLTIQLSNEAGQGPAVVRTFLIGYDMPAAPRNVLLTDSALTTTLTWSAPTVGTYGEAYDETKLRYDVVRYPEELTVASGITDTVFVEKHGNDMLRYYYVVYSCNDTVRSQGVVSNPVVVGAPLTPPYGGVFNVMGDMYNYYTILDENKDSYTWLYESETGSAVYMYNWQQSANDWLISPPIYYDKDAPYQLVFSTFSTSADYPESMLVTLGRDKTPDAQTEILLDLPVVPAQEDDGSISTYTLDFTVPETGVYYYAFKAYSDAYQDYLFLYNIQLKGTSGVEGVKSENRNFDAYAQGQTINIINPSNDAVSVYTVNGQLVGKTDDTTCGIDVVPGIYIVKSSRDAIKIAVK